MKKHKWATFAVITGGLLLLQGCQQNLRQEAFQEGIDCIIEGGIRTFSSTPKICSDYYDKYTEDLRTLIKNSPDTAVGKIEKEIWVRHLKDLNYLRTTGLTEKFFQTGL